MKKILLACLMALVASPVWATEVVPNFQFDTVTGNLAVQNFSGDQVTLFTISPTAPDGMSIPFLGATSGTTILQPSAVAAGTLTLPATTDTLIGKATTDTLTNKTYDTAGAGNVLDINGNQVNAVTGTGATVVLATSPTFVTPNLGAASATSLNVSGLTASRVIVTDGSKNLTSAAATTGSGSPVFATSPTITTPTFASGGVTFTGSSSGTTVLQPSATASGTLTLPAATDTLTGKATTDTLTNKTYDTAGTGNVFRINGTGITAVTGTGAVVLATSPSVTTPTLTGTVLAAGSTSVAPLNYTSGTNLTSATAGTAEYDGSVFYETPVASNRGVTTNSHIISLTTNYTLTDSSAAQKAFNATTNGQITLPTATAYLFDLAYFITNTGTTSHQWEVLFGGTAAAATPSAMQCISTTATSNALAAAQQVYTTTLFSLVIVTPASTSATETVAIHCVGRINITTAGTLIPQIKLSAGTGGTEVMLGGSYFRMNAIGANTVTSVGNWN